MSFTKSKLQQLHEALAEDLIQLEASLPQNAEDMSEALERYVRVINILIRSMNILGAREDSLAAKTDNDKKSKKEIIKELEHSLDRLIAETKKKRVMAALPNNQSWKLGVADDVGRYGAHIPGGAQATNIGMTSHPMTYYAATPLRISGQDKALTSGTIRLQLHVLRLTPPAL